MKETIGDKMNKDLHKIKEAYDSLQIALGGSMRLFEREEGEIALKNARQEVPDHDCKEESCKVCLDYLGEGSV